MEADNTAVLGVPRAFSGTRHVITTAIEHPDEIRKQLAKAGFDAKISHRDIAGARERQLAAETPRRRVKPRRIGTRVV
jgi:cysteine sulfinate desulfinase/cysteine desulfurase-like protein